MVKMSLGVIMSLFLSLYIPCYLVFAPQPQRAEAALPALIIGGIIAGVTSSVMDAFLGSLNGHLNPNPSSNMVPFSSICGRYEHWSLNSRTGSVIYNPDFGIYQVQFSPYNATDLGYRKSGTSMNSYTTYYSYNGTDYLQTYAFLSNLQNVADQGNTFFNVPCDLLPPGTLVPDDLFSGSGGIPDGYYTGADGVTIQYQGGVATNLGNIGLSPGYTAFGGAGNSSPPPVPTNASQPPVPSNGSASMGLTLTSNSINSLKNILASKFDFQMNGFNIHSWLPFMRSSFPSFFDFTITIIPGYSVTTSFSHLMNVSFSPIIVIFRDICLIVLLYQTYIRLKMYLLTGGQ